MKKSYFTVGQDSVFQTSPFPRFISHCVKFRQFRIGLNAPAHLLSFLQKAFAFFEQVNCSLYMSLVLNHLHLKKQL